MRCARSSARSASRRSFRGARCSIRSPCWDRRWRTRSASATSCSTAASPRGCSLSGIASPWVGRRIDRGGGRAVLAGGSRARRARVRAARRVGQRRDDARGLARRRRRDGGVPVRSGVRDALSRVRRVVSARGDRADAVRRLREHGVLAAVAIPARNARLARRVRRACGIERAASACRCICCSCRRRRALGRRGAPTAHDGTARAVAPGAFVWLASGVRARGVPRLRRFRRISSCCSRRAGSPRATPCSSAR